MQLVADPSGESTVTPDYIIDQKSANKCVTCLEAFIDDFEASGSAANYETNDFGQSDASQALDENATTVPSLSASNIGVAPGYDNVALSFTNGVEGNLVYCTLIVDSSSGGS